jgi:hypothetical protein
MAEPRPGHRLTTSLSAATAMPVVRSVSKVICCPSPGAGGAATRVPAGTLTSAASSAILMTSGALAGCAGTSRIPSISRNASLFFSGACSSRRATACRSWAAT